MERGRTHANTASFSSSVRRSSRLSVVSHGLVVGPIMPWVEPLLRSLRRCVDCCVMTQPSCGPLWSFVRKREDFGDREHVRARRLVQYNHPIPFDLC